MYSFFKFLDITVINAWIIYKSVLGKYISWKYYIQQLANEFHSNYIKDTKFATNQNYALK